MMIGVRSPPQNVMYEQPHCFPGSFYSTRLLWKVLSQTKVIVSVLKAEKGVRKKVSIRTRTRTQEWVENDGYVSRQCSGENEKTTLLGRKKSKRKIKTDCYLCQLHHRNNNPSRSTLDLRLPSYPSTPSLHSLKSRESLLYLPITRSQPPIPPRRSTSLPYYTTLKKLRRAQIVTGPHYSIPDFRLREDEGYAFRYLVGNMIEGGNDCESMRGGDSIWKLALQVSHDDAGIRRLVIAVGGTQRAASRAENTSQRKDRTPTNYCFISRHLRILLSGVTKGRKTDSRTWELSFLAIYLLTYIYTHLSHQKLARFYLRTGYHVLKRALRYFESDENGNRLPGEMIEITRAFGRLELR